MEWNAECTFLPIEAYFCEFNKSHRSNFSSSIEYVYIWKNLEVDNKQKAGDNKQVMETCYLDTNLEIPGSVPGELHK